ncbi:hypothetical protein JD844_030936 [Phrynosoma platyrhinos]|uniref:Uncharacterized protein n=1 Tax=Phrynosoma platyrhinos TaxID=52577 RepID=A0ABQ7T0G8_PHRPL|nr:hypothetical protein JD844_030936 [Phrynosoma platyrhinos]
MVHCDIADFDDGISFLESEQGSAFLTVFRHLRLQYIISDLASARIVERDNLIPTEELFNTPFDLYILEWLSSVYKQQWFAMLRAEQENDIGCLKKLVRRSSKETVCGVAENLRRMVNNKLLYMFKYCWRWTGFNFGFDLLVTYTNRYIIFKRNTLNQPCSGAVSLQPRRNIAFRLRLTSFDSSGKLIGSRTVGYQILTLEKDQEQVVMNLDSRLLIFPLYICCNFLYTSPEKRKENEGHPENPES